MIPLLVALALGANVQVRTPSAVGPTGTSTVPLSAPGINSSDGGTISGSLAANGIVSTALSPAAPTVTATGGTGTAWYYCDTQSTGAGESTCSADGTVSGGAALSGTVYNTISGSVLPGANAVTIYQCSSAACTTTHKMGAATITAGTYSYKDATGSTAGVAAPLFDASGALTAGATNGAAVVGWKSAVCTYALANIGGTLSVETTPLNCGGGGNAIGVSYLSGVSGFINGSPNFHTGLAIGSSGSSLSNLGVSTQGGCSMASASTCTVAVSGCTSSSVCFATPYSNAATTDAVGVQAQCAAGIVTLTAKSASVGTETFNVWCAH